MTSTNNNNNKITDQTAAAKVKAVEAVKTAVKEYNEAKATEAAVRKAAAAATANNKKAAAKAAEVNVEHDRVFEIHGKLNVSLDVSALGVAIHNYNSALSDAKATEAEKANLLEVVAVELEKAAKATAAAAVKAINSQSNAEFWAFWPDTRIPRISIKKAKDSDVLALSVTRSAVALSALDVYGHIDHPLFFGRCLTAAKVEAVKITEAEFARGGKDSIPRRSAALDAQVKAFESAVTTASDCGVDVKVNFKPEKHNAAAVKEILNATIKGCGMNTPCLLRGSDVAHLVRGVYHLTKKGGRFSMTDEAMIDTFGVHLANAAKKVDYINGTDTATERDYAAAEKAKAAAAEAAAKAEAERKAITEAAEKVKAAEKIKKANRAAAIKKAANNKKAAAAATANA